MPSLYGPSRETNNFLPNFVASIELAGTDFVPENGPVARNRPRHPSSKRLVLAVLYILIIAY